VQLSCPKRNEFESLARCSYFLKEKGRGKMRGEIKKQFHQFIIFSLRTIFHRFLRDVKLTLSHFNNYLQKQTIYFQSLVFRINQPIFLTNTTLSAMNTFPFLQFEKKSVLLLFTIRQNFSFLRIGLSLQNKYKKKNSLQKRKFREAKLNSGTVSQYPK
jgi:hypothetical protein